LKRGEIVVYRRPPTLNRPDVTDIVKRIVAVPGETIEARDGKVYINGSQLNESYLPPGTVTTNLPSRVIAPGQYFVMGDNRSNSSDSRFYGPITQDLIIGVAVEITAPVNRATSLTVAPA
jgi:signal peptidase I